MMTRISIVLLLLVSAARAEPIHDTHGFSFVLPSDFHEFPVGKNKPEVLQSFARAEPGDPTFTVLRIEALPGTIGREELDRAAVERAARRGGRPVDDFQYRKIRWRSFDLDLVITHATIDEQAVTIAATQVPLEAQAIQIFVSAPRAAEPQALADLAAILGSLDGKSNWLTVGQRSYRLGVVVGGFVAVLLVVVWLQRRRRAG